MNEDFAYGFVVGFFFTLGIVSILLVAKLTYFRFVTYPKLQKKYKEENNK